MDFSTDGENWKTVGPKEAEEAVKEKNERRPSVSTEELSDLLGEPDL